MSVIAAEHFLGRGSSSITDGKLVSIDKLWKRRRLTFGDMEAIYSQFKSWQTSLDFWAETRLCWKIFSARRGSCNHCGNAHLYNISLATMKVGAIWRQLDNYGPFAGYRSKPTLPATSTAPLLDRATCPIHQFMKPTLCSEVYFKWARTQFLESQKYIFTHFMLSCTLYERKKAKE